jgi:hypothetical protein
VHDYRILKCLYRYIHDENRDNCRKCTEEKGGKCYAEDVPTLFFDTSETTDIVFISESPFDYPKNNLENSDDFVVFLDTKLRCTRDELLGKPPESKPRNICEFIYQVFRPLFEVDTQDSLAKVFLENVYWTHAGKKSFKPWPWRKRLPLARQCMKQLLIKELQATQPKLTIMASSIASYALLGKGFTELFLEQKTKGNPLLVLQEQCSPSSLLYDALKEGVLPSDWMSKLAIFPNPSPTPGTRKNLAYVENKALISTVISNIHGRLREVLNPFGYESRPVHQIQGLSLCKHYFEHLLT